MLFAFRGIRMFQVIMVVVSLTTGVGAVLALKGFTDDGVIVLLLAAVLLGIVFLWAFTTAIRIPTSFVAIAPERTRIRFAGFIDTVIGNDDILSARLVKRPAFIGMLGVRANFNGAVTLATSFGPVAELTLKHPVRVWVIPRLIRVRATRLSLTVRNPQKLVERFAATPAPAAPATRAKRRR